MTEDYSLALEVAKHMYPDAEILSAEFVEDTDGNQILKFNVRLPGVIHYINIQGTITDD